MKKMLLLLFTVAAITLILSFVMEKLNRSTYESKHSHPVNLEISSLEEFEAFAQEVAQGNDFSGQYVQLKADLDFSGKQFVMVGGEEQSLPFCGVFDGMGHCISGIMYEHPEGPAGLFAYLQGVVKNLQMMENHFSGKLCGAVAADSYNGAVLNCEISSETAGDVCGSVVGRLHGNLFNCVASSEVFAGEVKKGMTEHCYVTEAADISALNSNLSFISGYYQDTEFLGWTEGDLLGTKSADLLEELSARLEMHGREWKIKGYYSGNDRRWCFVLPAGFKNVQLTIEAVTSEGGYESFRRAQGEETIIFTWKDRFYPIDFICADNVDTLYVSLEKQKSLADVHANKLEEIPGVLTWMDTEGDFHSEVLKGFYGHGNDSWAVEKKSYNLKLDTAADILGLGANEDFSLLACYRDNSLMCYVTTTELCKELGFKYSPEFRLVNLYVSGEYAGVYFLAEKVELDTNRIEIDNVYENEKLVNHNYLEGFSMGEWRDEDSSAARYFYYVDQEPEDLTGGYLLEADIVDYTLEESRFVSERGIPMTMKRARYSSEAQVNYIADYWQEFEDALFAENGRNEKGKHYSEYIDMESFAMQWLIYELTQEGSMSSSIYFYKESDLTGDGLLHACFPWDMEHSYVMSDKLQDIWNLTEKSGTLYGYWAVFTQHEDFMQELSRVWQEKFLPAIELMIAEESIEAASGMKNLRWYEERISGLDHLENSRWRKMYPLNRCQTNREFLSIRREVISNWLAQYNLTFEE